MSHHVCISLQLSWKTTVDDGTPCSQSIKPAALTHNGPVIIVHIITASHSVCHTDNLIEGYWLGYYILEDFSHLVHRSVFIIWGLPVAPTRGYTTCSCNQVKPDQRMEENLLMWENVSFFKAKNNGITFLQCYSDKVSATTLQLKYTAWGEIQRNSNRTKYGTNTHGWECLLEQKLNNCSELHHT